MQQLPNLAIEYAALHVDIVDNLHIRPIIVKGVNVEFFFRYYFKGFRCRRINLS